MLIFIALTIEYTKKGSSSICIQNHFILKNIEFGLSTCNYTIFLSIQPHLTQYINKNQEIPDMRCGYP